MNSLTRLLLVRHLPGRHNQQLHAGARGGASGEADLLNGEITILRPMGVWRSQLGAQLADVGGTLAVVKRGSDKNGKEQMWPERERAAYLVGRRLGLVPIPRTVLRGSGADKLSIQEFVPSARVWAEVPQRERRTPVLQSQRRDMRVMDLVLNNHDRWGANLLEKNGVLIAIDHGHAFSDDPRIRNAMRGAPPRLTPRQRSAVESLRSSEQAVRRDMESARMPSTESDKLFQRINWILGE